MNAQQTRIEAKRQITKLIETSTDEDKQAIEQERREGHGMRLRKEIEDQDRKASGPASD